LLVEPDGETLAARAAKGLEAEVERGFRVPIGHGFARTKPRPAAVVAADMSDLADARFELRDGKPVASVTGEVDASNAQRLGDRIYDAASNQALGLVVDLTEVTYIDSAGVGLLFDLASRLHRRQLTLHVVRANGSQVAEVLGIVALDEVATSHGSVDDAVAALTGAAG
jgi:anti-anti-sigma factor